MNFTAARANVADLRAFIAIADHRSFRAAARTLGVSPSALSHIMRSLETRLGVRLLNRTTRSVALTDAGERLLNRIRPSLADLDDAMSEMAEMSAEPKGSLRIAAKNSGATMLVRDVIPKFIAEYPGIQVDVVAEGALIDIVAEGFDAGVRLLDQVPRDMIAVRLGPVTRAIIVATPEYLSRVEIPQEPQDLLRHQCIRYRFDNKAIYFWELEKSGRATNVDVLGSLIVNRMELVIDAVLSGVGIGFIPEHLISNHVREGRLIHLMEDWCPTIDGYYLYYPSNRHPPTALRLFIDAVRASGISNTSGKPVIGKPRITRRRTANR